MEVLDLMASNQLQDCASIRYFDYKKEKKRSLNVNGNPCFCSHDRHVGRSIHTAKMYKICVETLKHLQSHGGPM